jgi:uncharacterized protein YhaN
MKILSCHIENFGTLSNRDFTFRDGINTVLEDNGSGKSTLAVFIKSMFFGFPKFSSKDIDINERQKYSPWQGGAYGGYLEFFAEGNTFRIERFFGDKEAQDKVHLYEMPMGRESPKYDTKKLGESIFGIDASGFEKSVYYSQRLIKSDLKDDVYAILSELMEEENDMRSFGKADKALSEALKDFNKNSNNDILSKTEAERENARRNLENAKNLISVLNQKENQIKDFRHELDHTEKELSAVQENMRLARLRERYIHYVSTEHDYQNACTLLTAYEKEFQGGAPTKGEVEELPDKLEKLYGIESSVKELEAELNEKKKLLTQYERGEAIGQDKLSEILEEFDNNPPTQSDLDEATALYGEINRINHSLSAITVKTETARSMPSKYTFLFFIMGLVLIAAGSATIFFLFEPGIALLCVGAVSIIISLAVHLFACKKRRQAALADYQKKKDALTAERDILTRKLETFFAGYKMEAGDIPKTLMSLQQKLVEYNKQKEYIDRELERTANSIDELTKKLQEYRILKEAVKNELSLYFEKKGIGCQNGLRSAYQIFSAKYEQYLRQKAIAADSGRRLAATEKPALPADFVPDDPRYDLDALNAKEKAFQAQKNSLSAAILKSENEIREIRTIVDLIPEYEAEEELINNKYQKLQSEKDLLTKTRQMLRQAHDNLSERYLGKLKDSFNRYVSAIAEKEIPITVDAKFDYKIQESGALRKEEYFSRGLRDLFDIAAHLALADAVFKGEKPFLLLDDPFKNLDDKKLERAKSMLKILAEERQILYLVCHSSRA